MSFELLGVSFWIGAALLAVVAMLVVLAPWIFHSRSRIDRRSANIAFAKTRLGEIERDFQGGIIDANEYHQLTLEQQRRLLGEIEGGGRETYVTEASPSRNQGRGLLLAFALIAPLFAGGFYFYSGSWPDWRIQQLIEKSERELQSGDDNRNTLEKLSIAIKRSLAQREDKDGRRRFMLAQLDMAFHQYGAAAEQFSLILKKFPEDANIAAQYSQALYLAGNRQLTAEVLAQAQHALQLDPNQTTALGLLGIAAFERRDFAQALAHWRHLQRLLPPNSPSLAMIEQGITQAAQQLGPEGFPGPKFTVTVSVSSELIAGLPLHGTLFVFAKAVDGPPMPLAVARLDPSKLPLEVTLDNSMAMAPGMDLSSAKQVQIFARITASGQVRGEVGDLEGNSAPLAVADSLQKVTLKIDRRL
jgi:cytochrome c-type biogenesis protein CcmH